MGFECCDGEKERRKPEILRRLQASELQDAKGFLSMPLISESLDTLGGAKWFSTFDLRAGYHQMALHPNDKHKTGFVTRKGSFQFKVLPFGLCNSPASFCRLMNLVLAGLNYEVCLVYLDDIIAICFNGKFYFWDTS